MLPCRVMHDLEHGRVRREGVEHARREAELLADSVEDALRPGRNLFQGRSGQSGHGR